MGKFTYGNKSSQEFKRNQFYRKRKSDDFRPYTGGRRNDKSNDSSVNIGRDNNTKYHGYSNNEGMGKYQQSGRSDNFTRDQDNNRRNKSDNNNYDRFERKNNYDNKKGFSPTKSFGDDGKPANVRSYSENRYGRSERERFNRDSGRRFGSGSANSNRFYRGRVVGGRGRRKPGFVFDEKMFVKKAIPIAQVEEYVPQIRFSELDVDQALKNNIKNKGYDIPTPIQDQTLVNIMEGNDLLGIADTGTGKTAAFLIPMIDKILKDRSSKVLIITPTRELADQINQELYTLTRDIKIYSVLCIGGSNINNQIYNLKRGYNFVIGTPGRLKDLFDRKFLDLQGFNTIVLDEVDRMLDMGFVHEIKHLISFLPENRQSLCFSATVDKKVEEIINAILKENYIKVSVKTGETAQNVEQDIVRIERHDEKIPKLIELLNSDGFEKVLVFVNTKREVDHLDRQLFDKGFKVTSIHGEKRQRERQRAIESFKSGRANILVATDVAARGLDIKNVTHVINFDIPMNYEDYIHRVGRTGRANKMGVALTFVEGHNTSAR
ncbi:MAG TPA: DEAD/DEAH box helicase [Candidatus Dojkabacteria bacterium]|nr:DEAD/DEAH box helicase [Candidatus Dojkabacteria bacterium]